MMNPGPNMVLLDTLGEVHTLNAEETATPLESPVHTTLRHAIASTRLKGKWEPLSFPFFNILYVLHNESYRSPSLWLTARGFQPPSPPRSRCSRKLKLALLSPCPLSLPLFYVFAHFACLLCMSVYCMPTWYPWKPEEVV